MVDGQNNWAMFDFPMHAAGDFDAITNVWVHVVLVVSAKALTTYDDGETTPDLSNSMVHMALSGNTFLSVCRHFP